MIWTKAFWRGASERVIKTGAQVAASMVTVGVPVFDLDWRQAAGVTATAMLYSLLTSIGDAEATAAPYTSAARRALEE